MSTTKNKRNDSYIILILTAVAIVSAVSLFALVTLSHVSYEPEPVFNPAVLLAETVKEDDHSKGRVDAPVKLFIYTDPECPFCKSLHQNTLPQLLDKYGDSLFVTYRYLPLPSRPKGLPEAQAAECVFMLNGNDAFWNFMDELFTVTPSGNGLDLSLLPLLAEQVGVNRAEYAECIEGNLSHKKVENDIIEATLLGLSRTPSSVLVKGDEFIQVTGDDYYRLDTVIEYLLNK